MAQSSVRIPPRAMVVVPVEIFFHCSRHALFYVSRAPAVLDEEIADTLPQKTKMGIEISKSSAYTILLYQDRTVESCLMPSPKPLSTYIHDASKGS